MNTKLVATKDKSKLYSPELGVFVSYDNLTQLGSDKNHKGYRTIYHKGKNFLEHRLAWETVNGPIPKNKQVDHINGNPADNRIKNLRLVDPQENQRNMKLSKLSKTGYPGVHFDVKYNTYRVAIYYNRQKIHLGIFDSKEKAILARKKAEKQYGYHPNHGRNE